MDMGHLFQEFIEDFAEHILAQEMAEANLPPQEQIISDQESFHSVLLGSVPSEVKNLFANRSRSAYQQYLNFRLLDAVDAHEVYQKLEVIKSGFSGMGMSEEHAIGMTMSVLPKLDPKLAARFAVLELSDLLAIQTAKYKLNSEGLLNNDYFFNVSYCYNDLEPDVRHNYFKPTGLNSFLRFMLLQLANLTGNESSKDLEGKMYDAFEGKTVVQLGCGPGFFLKNLQNYGANVIGIDKNGFSSEAKKRIEQSGVPIHFTDAEHVYDIIGESADVIFSTEFLSNIVLQKDGTNILKSAYDTLKPGGLSLHFVNGIRDVNPLNDLKNHLTEIGLPSEFVETGIELLLKEKSSFLGEDNMKKLAFEPGAFQQIGYVPLVYSGQLKLGDSRFFIHTK